MSVRILHCSTSIENYELCISEKVAGFTKRGAEHGDLVYLAVKVNGLSYCGARGILSEITDFKPWPDADRYTHCLTLIDIEYCEPFALEILSRVGGSSWGAKYLQQSKPLDSEAIVLLDDCFNEIKKENYINIRQFFKVKYTQSESTSAIADSSAQFEVTNAVSSVEADFVTIQDEVIEPDLQEDFVSEQDENISIMATFQTVQFLNESDKARGLESLVNTNFYPLFPMYPENRTLLIPKNRMFKTKGPEDFKNIGGIRGIPDGLLIVFNKDFKNPLQINMIEYECYGEKKTRPLDKSNFFNGQIIPQLMKFASSFSIVTDRNIRNETIKDWKDRIIQYIDSSKELEAKCSSWIHEMNPDIPERKIDLKMSELLEDALKNNVRILLIIDELSSEQKETLNNVINAFKLENGESIKFRSYVVRLVQQINVIDSTQEYALTVQ